MPSVAYTDPEVAWVGLPSICGRQMRLLAFIMHSADIRQMRDHLGVVFEPPRLAPARGQPLLGWVRARRIHSRLFATGPCRTRPHAVEFPIRPPMAIALTCPSDWPWDAATNWFKRPLVKGLFFAR
jgi:hypothetical protein